MLISVSGSGVLRVMSGWELMELPQLFTIQKTDGTVGECDAHTNTDTRYARAITTKTQIVRCI